MISSITVTGYSITNDSGEVYVDISNIISMSLIYDQRVQKYLGSHNINDWGLETHGAIYAESLMSESAQKFKRDLQKKLNSINPITEEVV